MGIGPQKHVVTAIGLDNFPLSILHTKRVISQRGLCRSIARRSVGDPSLITSAPRGLMDLWIAEPPVLWKALCQVALGRLHGKAAGAVVRGILIFPAEVRRSRCSQPSLSRKWEQKRAKPIATSGADHFNNPGLCPLQRPSLRPLASQTVSFYKDSS